MRHYRLLPLFLLFTFIQISLSAAVLPPGFVEVPLATGLDPTAMALAPDGRIFITEKYGAVRIVENGQLLPDPFVQLNVDNYNERGLSGIAIDPGFAQNGYVYLYYTVKNGGHNRLSRVQAIGNYAASEEILLELPPLAGTIHNGGAMVFGDDGKLYLAVGDGADGTQAPSLQSLLGKVLRLNPDGTVPPGNPFVMQTTGILQSIWAVGLRNPFSMARQPGTGRIFVCDVGSQFTEEVNAIEPGMHYGWNLLEGQRVAQPVPANYRDPLYAYPHSLGCSVVGAAFYNPPTIQFPASYAGQFFFADYCQGYIKTVDPATGLLGATFATQIDRPLCILTGQQGELYYISRGGMGGGSDPDNTSTLEGMLWRVDYVGTGAPVFSAQPQPRLQTIGETATFTANANGSDPITYQWQRDGQTISGATGKMLIINNLMLADSGALLRCLATNAFGQVTSQAALLRVTANQRPLPVILLPLTDNLYSAGDTLVFAGEASDAEQGALSADALTWRLDLHHDQHSHPGLAATSGIAAGTYVVPLVGETADNVWLRIYLTARDQIGLTTTVHRDIFPHKVRLRVETDPPGLSVRVDGKTYTTPVELASVRGLRRQVEALPSFSTSEAVLAFRQWQDGSTAALQTGFLLDSFTVLRAQYEKTEFSNGTGLYATYYKSPEGGGFQQPVFSRVDSVVSFDWAQGAPAASLPNDNFTVRWLGEVQPLFTEQLTFHVFSDDGCRLWVNNELLIDAWYPKASSEVAGSIFLEKGKKYAVRLEYFENGGGALVELRWSGDLTPRGVIPRRQLFPTLPVYSTAERFSFRYVIQPNPVVEETLRLRFESTHQEKLQLRIFDAAGRLAAEYPNLSITMPRQLFDWPIPGLAAGVYRLQVLGNKVEPSATSFVK